MVLLQLKTQEKLSHETVYFKVLPPIAVKISNKPWLLLGLATGDQLNCQVILHLWPQQYRDHVTIMYTTFRGLYHSCVQSNKGGGQFCSTVWVHSLLFTVQVLVRNKEVMKQMCLGNVKAVYTTLHGYACCVTISSGNLQELYIQWSMLCHTCVQSKAQQYITKQPDFNINKSC